MRLTLALWASLFSSIVLSACAGAPPKAALAPQRGEQNPRGAEPQVLEALPEQKRAVAIEHATLLLGTGARIEDGSVLFARGRIVAIGPAAEVTVPEDAERIDGRGKFVTPGLIDTHSHLGVYAVPNDDATADGNEMTDPTTPYVFSEHAFWPQDPALRRAVAGGVTTLQILPGSGNVIGGRAVTLKLRPSLSARAMRFPNAPFGLKMACGENPKRVYGEKGRQPMSRMGNISVLRSIWIEAQAYLYERREAERKRNEWLTARAEAEKSPGKKLDDEPAGIERKLGLETLADALEGKILVHIHCYRADEMLQMLSLADELGFTVRSFHHAVEAYKIADVLARRNVAGSLWSDWWGFKLEAYDGIEENVAMLAAAGGRAIVHSDSGVGIQRLNQDAAKALYAGRRAGLALTEDQALTWITAQPAWALGVADQTGTLETGKMADLVLWDQSPFSIYAQTEQVFIDGERAFSRAIPSEPGSDFEVGTPRFEVAP